MTDPRSDLKVLSVTGAGRSGTTVLASILDGVDGFASAGEMRRLWERGVAEGRPCGCGLIPTRCPVWSGVVTRTLSAGVAATPDEALQQIIAAQHEINRWRNRFRVLRSATGGDTDWVELQRVRSALGEACMAFADSTGARVVVGTSKRAEDAAVFAALDGVEHYVLHIVRDPRAVVHSWRRPKAFSAAGTTRTMGTRRLPSTVRRWVENCLGTEMLLRQLPPSRWLRVRYEDFSRDPRGVVDQILSLLGESGPAPFESDDTVRLNDNHIVAGNPSRFTTGSVKIRADEEWKTLMPRRDQLLIELTTKPLMLRYGYGRARRGATRSIPAG
jgi:Sulfotransferase family